MAGLNNSNGLNSNYIPKVYSPPNTPFTVLDVRGLNDDVLKRVIGKNGYYVKAITHRGLGYIWLNKNTGFFEIYAREGEFDERVIQYTLADGHRRLHNRIMKVLCELYPETYGTYVEVPEF